MAGTGRGAEAGILIRGGAALENAQRVDTLVFDKTGTLTEGRPSVGEVVPASGFDVATLLDLAGSVEASSEHPAGEAIVTRAQTEGRGDRAVSGFRALPGRGVQGLVQLDGTTHRVLVGTAGLLSAEGVETAPIAESLGAAEATGAGVALVAVDGRVAGLFTLRDAAKPGAAAAVSDARAAGIDVWLLSGDSRRVAEESADGVGIPRDRVLAEVLPEDKAAAIARLRADGRVVAMVGDGVNDAPALATADVGIAIGTGADVAVEAADVTLVGGDPRGVAAAIRLSRSTMRVVRQNLAWAFGYNVVLIPVAMGALYPFFGVLLNPGLAAGAMALSSVSVVLNSLRLRALRLRPAGQAGA